MKCKNVFITGFLLLSSVCANVYASSCPDSTEIDNAPATPIPSKTGFSNWTNSWLAAWYTPYHMVHDELVVEGRSATIVGKFDYDALMHKDLEYEKVKVYLYGTGMSAWEYLGTYTTNGDGKIYVDAGTRAVGQYVVHMVVTGDLSTADGYLTVIKPGTESVLFDIDGTLTLDDWEAVGDYLGISTAQSYAYVAETVLAYKNKGYCITYLTARSYWQAKDTREWLNYTSIPLWHLHTNPDAEITSDTSHAEYKEAYINSLLNNGLDIIRVYGNAESDIEAYENAGIPKSETYIVGEHAGEQNTQAIETDYSYHYSTVVIDTPNAGE